jgi:hypothetical protein
MHGLRMSTTRSGSRLPTFLLLGAAKCGTTSLAHYLAQHPDVFFSTPKEPLFFEADYEKGLDHYWETYFRGWSGQRAVGEGRVWNLYLPFVAARIRESLPEAKLVAILRDPVERVYSHWWQRYSRGQEPLGFEAAVAADRARIERGERFEGEEGARRWNARLVRGESPSTDHRVLLDLGFYAEQLERYQALFPAAQLKVVFHEDLARRLPAVMSEIFDFLGVDPAVPLNDASPKNVRAESLRSPGARRLWLAASSLGLRRLVPGPLRRAARGLLERPGRRPAPDPGVRRELVAYYEPHTTRLERLLGRDLSAWRES